MDYLCLLGVCRWRTGVSVAESHTYGNDDIGFLCLDIRGIVAMHTYHTHVQGMASRQCRQSKQCACCWNVCLLNKLHQLVLSTT